MVLGGTFKLINEIFDTIMKELCQRIHKLFPDPNNRQSKNTKRAFKINRSFNIT